MIDQIESLPEGAFCLLLYLFMFSLLLIAGLMLSRLLAILKHFGVAV
jgi:hypothetical protein